MAPEQAWLNDYLQQHNKYRSLHQAPVVKFNPELCSLAQQWAEHLAAKDAFAHSDCKFQGKPLGENIAMKMSSSQSDFPGHAFVDQWYSEVERYDFRANSGPSTGHFTQVVWKGSLEVGVGKAVTKSGKVLVVGNYYPAGNMMGQNAQNVAPTRDGKITLPPKDEKKPMQMKMGGGGFGDSATGGAGGEVENYRSVKRQQQSRRLPDGRTEVVTKETYTMQDGSTKVVEKKEVK